MATVIQNLGMQMEVAMLKNYRTVAIGAALMIGLGWSLQSKADKVEDVKAAIKKAAGCESKELSNADALRLMKDLFMKCNPGETVDAEGCKVKCLKDNAGAVVGK